MSSTSHKKLGQLLVERGWVSGEQVLRAIMSQRSHGGRLGTCLLELAVISEERLLEILAEQQETPAAQVDSLRYIPYDIVELVPQKVAERLLAVPFSASDREVEVAAMNARNVHLLDELAFCTNRRVRPYVTSEVRLYEALAKYYGFECPRRYAELADRLNRARYLWKGDSPAVANVDFGDIGEAGAGVIWSAVEEALDGSGIVHPASALGAPAAGVAAGETPALAAAPPEDSTAGRRGEPDEGPAPASEDLTLQDVDHLLRDASDARMVGGIVLRYLAQRFSRCAVFQVQRGRMVGWFSHGESFDRELFQKLAINLKEPSVFLNLRRGSAYHLGPLPPMPTHRQLVRCWGGEWPGDCLVMPIRVRDRMVAAFYGDRGTTHLGGLEIEEWHALATTAAAALELCILRRKLQAT